MAKSHGFISRRHLLRCAAGGLGTAIALPPLEAMFGSDAAFAAAGRGRPRFLAIYQPNGHQAATFTPASAQLRNFDLRGTNSEPLSPIMDITTIFRRMTSASAPSEGNAHLTAIVSWLSAKPIPNDDSRVHSISADVFIAEHYEKVAPTGRRQHLALAGSPFIDPGRTGYNNDMKSWLSSDRNGNRIQSDNNLVRTFDDLFRGADPGASQQQIDARRIAKKSVLDFVIGDIDALEKKLGAADKRVLSSYVDSIRDLEIRLDQLPAAGGTASCTKPNLTLSQYAPFAPDRTEPNMDRHWKETTQLLAVAFQCEAVRSVSYMIETEAGESGYPSQGLPDSHGLSHNPGTPGYGKRDRYHAQLYAEMIETFRKTPVADGNLMDNMLVLWGAGIGVNHSKTDLMAVLSGRVGTVKHNALRDMGGRSAAGLIPAILKQLGVLPESEGFGVAKPGESFDLSS